MLIADEIRGLVWDGHPRCLEFLRVACGVPDGTRVYIAHRHVEVDGTLFFAGLIGGIYAPRLYVAARLRMVGPLADPLYIGLGVAPGAGIGVMVRKLDLDLVYAQRSQLLAEAYQNYLAEPYRIGRLCVRPRPRPRPRG